MPIKTNPRIVRKDVYDYIATHSSLTRGQIKECFDVYSEMIKELSLSKYISIDTTIAFPNLGNFYFREIVGRKKGTVCNYPSKEKGKTVKVVLDKDEPTIPRLCFEVSPNINEKIKAVKKEELYGE